MIFLTMIFVFLTVFFIMTTVIMYGVMAREYDENAKLLRLNTRLGMQVMHLKDKIDNGGYLFVADLQKHVEAECDRRQNTLG